MSSYRTATYNFVSEPHKSVPEMYNGVMTVATYSAPSVSRNMEAMIPVSAVKQVSLSMYYKDMRSNA